MHILVGFYCLYANGHGYCNIQVITPVSDIFIFLLYIDRCEIVTDLLDTGPGTKEN